MKYEVGQKVRVFNVNAKKWGWSEDGEVGHVTKVARKLFTVATRGDSMVFRIEDGYRNDDYRHFWVKTLEEADQDKRREAAEETLRQVGLEISRRSSIDLALLEELAEVARKHLEEGQ